jgi:hypothetical protein
MVRVGWALVSTPHSRGWISFRLDDLKSVLVNDLADVSVLRASTAYVNHSIRLHAPLSRRPIALDRAINVQNMWLRMAICLAIVLPVPLAR